jgi:hypothetical protein
MRYGGFSVYSVYPADTRNTNSTNTLWQMQSSDYRADTRKTNVYNALRQTPIVATRAGGVRARPTADGALPPGVRRLVRAN